MSYSACKMGPAVSQWFQQCTTGQPFWGPHHYLHEDPLYGQHIGSSALFRMQNGNSGVPLFPGVDDPQRRAAPRDVWSTYRVQVSYSACKMGPAVSQCFQASMTLSDEQRREMCLLRRVYLGRLGDALRQRLAINSALANAVPSSVDGVDVTAEYMKARAGTETSRMHSSCFSCRIGHPVPIWQPLSGCSNQ
jgi:hypothetical protein